MDRLTLGRTGLLVAFLLSLLALAAGAQPATATATCDLVAASGGSDSAPGTESQPLRSVQVLVDSLAPGQTGCLRAGSYSDPSDNEIDIGTPSVTVTSYPGERATVVGRIWIRESGDGVTLADLDMDGTNPRMLPSPTVNSDDVVIRDNDITNNHTAICISLGSPDTYGRAHRTIVERNRVHDCGLLPATNQDHGIYVNSSDDAIIRDNLIYDNADRGIQLYADSQRTTVTGNIIDGNGQGVIFGGNERSASSDNIVENNIITNSKIRDNIESSWGGAPGTGNIARNNCVGGGAYDEGDGGILGTYPGGLGFEAIDNMIHVPDYAAPEAGDYTVPASDPCASLIKGATVDEVGGVSTGGGAVTISANRRSVRRMRPVRLTGNAAGAETVAILLRRGGHWRNLGEATTKSSNGYSMKVRLPSTGRLALKAKATGLKDSQALRVRVTKN